MSDLADREGFAVAYPAALGLLPAWSVDAAGPGNRDVAFVRDLVAAIAGSIPVADVFVAGMSNGGGMAGRLACDAADLVTAAAPVAAAHTSEMCSPSRPVPVVAFHGTGDLIVPYRGFAPLGLPPIEAWAAAWAQRNGCTPESVREGVADDVEVRSWGDCGADVVLYTVDGGRHGWPGSDRAFSVLDSTTSIDASEIMWEFFRRHASG
jgi:polyhydroxybutyrate depolymerase